MPYVDFHQKLRDKIDSIRRSKEFNGNLRAVYRYIFDLPKGGEDENQYRRFWRFQSKQTEVLDAEIREAIFKKFNLTEEWLFEPVAEAPEEDRSFYVIPHRSSTGFREDFVTDAKEADVLGGDGSDLEAYFVDTDHMAPAILPGRSVRFKPLDKYKGPGIYIISTDGEAYKTALEEGGDLPTVVAKLNDVPPSRIKVSYINESYEGFTLRREGDKWLNEFGEEVDFLIVGLVMYWPQNIHSMSV